MSGLHKQTTIDVAGWLPIERRNQKRIGEDGTGPVRGRESHGSRDLRAGLWADPAIQKRVRVLIGEGPGQIQVRYESPMQIFLPHGNVNAYRESLRALLGAVGNQRSGPGSPPVTLENSRRALATALAATTNRCLEEQL